MRCTKLQKYLWKPQKSLCSGKKIRKTLFHNEWWFSVVDVVEALTDSTQPRKYWAAMKVRVDSDDGFQLSTICRQLKLESSDGKKYETDCADTEGIFRIIQSIPSPKAEPFKRWLAKVGFERVQEIENPELATKRTRLLYKLKGYPDDWIEKRMRGFTIREELTDETSAKAHLLVSRAPVDLNQRRNPTFHGDRQPVQRKSATFSEVSDEWQKRGAKEEKDYEILTAEISKASFGITPNEYKKLKGLKRENLRDHMDDFELIFTMLGERSTTEIHKTENSHGKEKLKQDAKRGGRIAGIAKEQLEKELGRPIVSKDNFLPKKKSLKKLK